MINYQSKRDIPIVEPETIKSAKKLLEIAQKVNDSKPNHADRANQYIRRPMLQPVFETRKPIDTN